MIFKQTNGVLAKKYSFIVRTATKNNGPRLAVLPKTQGHYNYRIPKQLLLTMLFDDFFGKNLIVRFNYTNIEPIIQTGHI